ncbi:FAD-dependent oxidoreductase [Herbiconiux sp. KACC 21604]|nr:NAD(P)/FAD-dependent oxidoreductase [Herbiconiux sp. SALV-R1]QJU53304.1 NAD(P)-binding protein [Herbiconiux sp. SALV-R1]WPO88262.1 FAD-dependent oxidoreductase [Herbiconiux sp. KACC 21604]
MERRTFLAGALSAATLATLAACVPEAPAPTPSITPTVGPLSPVPAPAAYLRSAWADDPYSLGSFSMTPVGADPGDRATLREPVQSRVFFAGEATSAEFPGTVVGAARSGESAAASVVALGDPGERIAVIGAGLAGATAARDLTAAGFDVVVVEARDRVGGRIDTRDEAGWPFPVELGAASVTGTGLDELLTASDVDTLTLDASAELRTEDGTVVAPSTAGPDAVAAAVAWAKAQEADTSLASALAESGALAMVAPSTPTTSPADGGPLAPDEALTQYLDTTIASRYGAGPFALSASYGLDKPGLVDGTGLVVGGLDTLVRDCLEGLDVLLSSTVIRIGYDDDGASLRFGTGESLSVDRVVVTVPLGVLQAETIEFAPPLPEASSTAIAKLGVGRLEQLWLRFDEPFWSTEATVLSVVDDTSVIAEWINLLPSTGQAILIGLTASDDVSVTSKLGDSEFVETALATLAPFVDETMTATPTPATTPTAVP